MTDNEEKFNIDKEKDRILERVKQRNIEIELLRSVKKIRLVEKKRAIIAKFAETKKTLLDILKPLSDEIKALKIEEGDDFLEFHVSISNMFYRYYCKYEEQDILYIKYIDGKKMGKALFSEQLTKSTEQGDSIEKSKNKNIDIITKKNLSSLEQVIKHFEKILIESLEDSNPLDLS